MIIMCTCLLVWRRVEAGPAMCCSAKTPRADRVDCRPGPGKSSQAEGPASGLDRLKAPRGGGSPDVSMARRAVQIG